MKNITLTFAAAVTAFAFSSCVGLAIKGADEGSQMMQEHENDAVSDTGDAIQKGVKPINDAKDEVVDAVKDAFE